MIDFIIRTITFVNYHGLASTYIDAPLYFVIRQFIFITNIASHISKPTRSSDVQSKSTKMQTKHHPIENKFNRLSPYHFYCFSIMFIIKILLYWHLMSILFLSPPMKYTCINATQKFKKFCPCKQPIWDTTVFLKTMQTKFDIICDKAWLISFSQSILYVGTLFGSLLFGFMSDRYGRLSMYTICCFCISIAGCLVSAMPTAASYTFMRCFEGVGIGGAIVTGYVFVVEYCGARYRDTVTALYHIPLNIGHISLSGISYLVRDCDWLQLVLSVPVFFCVFTWWLLNESPKWLMDSDQIERAAKVMLKIAKFNKDTSTSSDAIQAEMQEYHTIKTSNAHVKINFREIFRHKKLRINLLCMAYIYFVCGMGYYGVSQYISNMSGNIHLNVAISGFLFIPGTIATIFLLKLLSRRTFLMVTNLLSGIFMICVISIPPDLKFARMVTASIGNTFFLISFIIVFLYSVELFPTSVRNSVLGLLSVLSRVGQIVAPPVNALDSTMAGSIYGISAILGAVLCYPLPETKNVELPSTVEDTEKLPMRPVLPHRANEPIQIK